MYLNTILWLGLHGLHSLYDLLCLQSACSGLTNCIMDYHKWFPGSPASYCIQIQDGGFKFHKRTWLFYRSLFNQETCHRLESIQKLFVKGA